MTLRDAFDDLLAGAVRFHGHLCPGQVLGVRMAIAGCREVECEAPHDAGKDLVVLVEIDRCAIDAIQALTGVSLGKRTLKHVDHGKTAATFVHVPLGRAVRVVARDDARERAAVWAAGERDGRRAQIAAYRAMPERDLLHIQRVVVAPGWLDRPRARVPCGGCGEDVHYGRQVATAEGRMLCRGCAGDAYYRPAPPPTADRAGGV